MLFSTLTVTVATVERSFRKLKTIKDYKRNSIGQSCLRNLAILAIEHKEVAKINYTVNDFENAKARNKLLLNNILNLQVLTRIFMSY